MIARALTVVLAAQVAAAPLPVAAADAARGQQIYQTYCVACHGGPGSVGGQAIAAGAGRPEAIRNAVRSVAAMSVLARVLSTGDVDDVAAWLAVLFGAPSPPAPAVLLAVEYYHAGLDHYFTTALPGEVAALDAGTGAGGWARTGASFQVWASAANAPAGASPVCRIYLPPAFGNSHFYSASPAECAEVRARFPGFVFEGDDVMAVILPDVATGACPAGSNAVFRVWNMRADTNHRYTTDRSVRDQMLARGHVPEGYGDLGVALCAPS